MERILKALLFLAAIGGSQAVAQLGFIPMPPPAPPQQVDPCAQLRANVATCLAQLNVLQGVLLERKLALAKAEAKLREVETWHDLFWAGVAEQDHQISYGQYMTMNMLLMQLHDCRTHVSQKKAMVAQTEVQIQTWQTRLQTSQAQLNAAGCR